jgi:Flp pilus assembly protein TadD
MIRHARTLAAAVLIAGVVSLTTVGANPSAGLAYAAGSGGSGTSSSGESNAGGGSASAPATQGLALAQGKIDASNYRGAIEVLKNILADEPNNADALNLLGYSNRMLGNKDESLGYYRQALKLNPNHVGANEYMGELYLEMNDLPSALDRLAVLASVCSACEEYADLKKAIETFKAKQG